MDAENRRKPDAPRPAKKTKRWRRMGEWLNTGIGAGLADATSGIVKQAAGFFLTPDLTGDIPFAPLDKPLTECVVTLISTAGFHLATDPPFDVDAADGDPSFRIIPSDTAPAQIRVAHTHYSHRYVEQDINVLFPIERLRELAAEHVFELAPHLFSFGFGGTLTEEYIAPPHGTAHQLVANLRRDHVDLALLVPA